MRKSRRNIANRDLNLLSNVTDLRSPAIIHQTNISPLEEEEKVVEKGRIEEVISGRTVNDQRDDGVKSSGTTFYNNSNHNQTVNINIFMDPDKIALITKS